MHSQLKVLTVVVAKVTSEHSLLQMLLADALVATISSMKSQVSVWDNRAEQIIVHLLYTADVGLIKSEVHLVFV